MQSEIHPSMVLRSRLMILWESMMMGSRKSGQDVEKVTLELLEEMVDEDSELISIYYGEDTTKEQAEALLEKVEETYGDCDVQLEYGGQPIYYFLLSVE